MIKIEKTQTYGWETAIRGMRNPMNSWDKSDSKCNASWYDGDYFTGFRIGPNDLDLMKRLVAAGTDHAKFMRMIVVSCDITAPLYWWKEMDTYKVGTVANSCSTMHKIAAKEFTRDDFSCEHLWDTSKQMLDETIANLNIYREAYNRAAMNKHKKNCWWQMIQLLPTSYNQRRTWMANYAVLRNIYHARRNHKLDEWHTFCQWVETLPYHELITDSAGT